ncbi:MAG: LacI family transcriptional regulator [Firmicutes bacterium]|nr:LacI family transcriptional regulator [Bacillota bacterium]
MKPTIKDVQKKTGLSLSTISKYLNGGHVLDRNRELIDEAVSNLDFKVNQFARSLKTNKSNMIGVLIPELNSTFNTALVVNTQDILRRNGYGVIVCDYRSDIALERQAMQFLIDKKVDGFLAIPDERQDRVLALAIREKIPVVQIDRLVSEIETDAVIINNRAVSKKAVADIIQMGHRRIGVITGIKNTYTMHERRAGYREALSEVGILYDESLDIREEATLTGGYNGFKRLMENVSPPSAVFLSNYEFTLGAIVAINEMGIKIGSEISVIGFDNLELAKVIIPKLTIVIQPMEAISKTAAELLLKRLSAKEDYPPEVIVMEARLELGDSVCNVR